MDQVESGGGRIGNRRPQRNHHAGTADNTKELYKRLGVALLALLAVASLGTLLGSDDDDRGLDVEGVPPSQITWERPPLHELIADFETNITADVQWLLDFAIIGRTCE